MKYNKLNHHIYICRPLSVKFKSEDFGKRKSMEPVGPFHRINSTQSFIGAAQ